LKSLFEDVIHKKSLLKEAFITHNAITVLGLVWLFFLKTLVEGLRKLLLKWQRL
jgi:hypothetical protein